MKTRITAIYLLTVISILIFSGCKNEGEPGPEGPAGLDATVYYSKWITPTAWSTNSGEIALRNMSYKDVCKIYNIPE